MQLLSTELGSILLIYVYLNREHHQEDEPFERVCCVHMYMKSSEKSPLRTLDHDWGMRHPGFFDGQGGYISAEQV